MARKSYINASKMIKMCRVCLTQSNNVMFDLTDDMALDDTTQICILDALENVVSLKVLLVDDFPQCICPMCISLLKMTFKFVNQFKDSQQHLRQFFDKSPTYEPPEYVVKQEEQLEEVDSAQAEEAPVEIIVGTNKFDLKDVIVIEEVKNEESSFTGFLQNLGREVSATFADKEKNKLAIVQDEDAVSIYMTDNENGVLPIKELKIDDDTNNIDYVLLEEEEQEETQIEFIEIETEEGNIESLIIDATENNEADLNKENTVDGPRVKKVIKVGKRKKLINERVSQGMIIMAPADYEGEPKVIDEEEDVFEREMQFPCDICKKIFPSNRSLRAHKKRTHFPKDRQYSCETCGYKNKTRSGYMHHKVKHMGKQFVCEICSKTYYTRAVLKVHMATHVNKRQHLCNVCGKGFNYANALIYHMRLHTGERNYKCGFCGERFRMPNALKRHERIHTGERPYKCRFCGRGFCSRGEVQCHENIHTGYRPYHCKHCRKGFTKTHNLKLHLLSHDGPHSCDICGRSFIEMAILSMHYKISHKDLERSEKEDDQIAV